MEGVDLKDSFELDMVRRLAGNPSEGTNTKRRGRPRKYQASSEVMSWTSEEIGRFIASLGLAEHKDKFVRSGISGDKFVKLSSPELRDNFLIANIGDRKKIIKGIANLLK